MTKEEKIKQYVAAVKARNEAKKWYDCIAKVDAGYPAKANIEGDFPIKKGGEYRVFTDEKDFKQKVGLGLTFSLKKKGL